MEGVGFGKTWVNKRIKVKGGPLFWKNREIITWSKWVAILAPQNGGNRNSEARANGVDGSEPDLVAVAAPKFVPVMVVAHLLNPNSNPSNNLLAIWAAAVAWAAAWAAAADSKTKFTFLKIQY
jgi:hypothetical protein